MVTSSKNLEEFTYAALASSALKQGIVEILQFVDGQSNMSEELIKKQNQEKDPFSIGG